MNRVQLKNNKIACIIFAILVFFSGFFIESVPADNSFVCAPIEKTNSSIQLVYIPTIDAQICTSEMVGVQNTSHIQQLTSRCNALKWGLRTSLNSLCPDTFQLQKNKFFMGLEASTVSSWYVDELIINYIQSSDGKKRIERQI